jgi:hypothetical protein
MLEGNLTNIRTRINEKKIKIKGKCSRRRIKMGTA